MEDIRSKLNLMSLEDISEAYNIAFNNLPKETSLHTWLLEYEWNRELEDYLDDRFSDANVADYF
jgi:hypothetical protein